MYLKTICVQRRAQEFELENAKDLGEN